MSTTDWFIVSIAGVLAAIPAGVLFTRSIWTGATRFRPVPALLALHAGLAFVVGTVATAAAIRSWQLVGQPPEEQAAALLDVNHLDGDRTMYALIFVLLVATATLVTLLLALAARFAVTDDPTERSIACAVLGLELGACGYGLALVATGNSSPLAIVAVAHLPVVLAAMVACWPPRHHHATDR